MKVVEVGVASLAEEETAEFVEDIAQAVVEWMPEPPRLLVACFVPCQVLVGATVPAVIELQAETAMILEPQRFEIVQ